jgi:hypothetical protein
LACARKELCLCSSKFPRLYLLTSVGSRWLWQDSGM